MDAALEDFLAANDLDDVLAAVKRIEFLSAQDETRILGLLSSWDTPQAIANLLMYPKLIPPDHRLDALSRGLQDDGYPYLKLAAVVGLQSVESLDITESQRLAVLHMLVSLIENHRGVLAARASAALSEWVRPGEGYAIAPLLRHPDSTVQHNILSILIEIVGLATIVDYLDVIFATGGYPPETAAACKARLSQIREINPQNESALPFDASPLSALLYSYLPNFSSP